MTHIAGEDAVMLKVKRPEGGIYCFLVTFDPQNQTLNIIDVRAQHEAASMEEPLAVNQVLHVPSADVEPSKPDVDSAMKDSTKESQVLQEPQSEALIHKKPKKSNLSAVDVAEPRRIEREYRPHDLLSRNEAAAYLGVTPQTLAVWQSTRRYNLKMVKVGGLAKYRKADLDAFVESRTVPGRRTAAKDRTEF